MDATKFKMTKFRFTSKEQYITLQKQMFKLGFRWNSDSGNVGQQRKMYDGGLLDGFIFVNKDYTMGVSPWYYGVQEERFIYTPRSVLEAAAKEAQEATRLKKKAQRQKRAANKFVQWNGSQGTAPFPVGTKLTVRFRDTTREDETYTVVAPGDVGPQYRWNHYGEGYGGRNDIVAYKVIEQAKGPRAAIRSATKERMQQEASSLVTLEEMVAGIVKDAGGREVLLVDNDGYTVFNGGKCPVPFGTLVDVKYRNGEKLDAVPALKDTGIRDAAERFWRHDSHISDIVAYRVTGFVEVPEADVVVQPVVEDTNPKRKYGVQSIPLSYWSPLASAYGALGLYNGALKYGKANFANTPVEASIYIDAAMRHLSAFAQGEELDPADGVPNLGGVLANVAILLEARAAGTLIDDRALMAGYLKERDVLKGVVKSLNTLHADKAPKHYTRENV